MSAAPRAAVSGELKVLPGVTVSEEYNDNVLLTRENRRTDTITEFDPAVHLQYRALFWDWDVDYVYYYRVYAQRTVKDDTTHALTLVNNDRIIHDLLFLDLKDDYARVSLDVARDYTQENNIVNQTDRNIFFASPYVKRDLSPRTTFLAGYGYRNTWYKDPAAVGTTEYLGYVQFARELSSRLTTTVEVRSNNVDFKRTDRRVHYRDEEALLTGRYEYAADSVVSLGAGNSWWTLDYGQRVQRVFWEGVLRHSEGSAKFSMEAGTRFVPDPTAVVRREDRFGAAVKKEEQRFTVQMAGSFREYRDVTTNTLQETDTGISVFLGHQLSDTTNVNLDVAVDQYRSQLAAASSLTRYLGGLELVYLRSKTATISLSYRRGETHAPDNPSAGYYNNRIILEAHKTF